MKANEKTTLETGFFALDFTLELVRVVAPVLGRFDAKLADQARCAAQSIALNLGEGRGRQGREQRQHFRYALGSARELHAALLLAEAFGYVAMSDLAVALGKLDRIQGMLWSLSRR